MYIATATLKTSESKSHRQATGPTQRHALERLRMLMERIDIRRFPIMEEFVWAFDVKIDQMSFLAGES